MNGDIGAIDGLAVALLRGSPHVLDKGVEPSNSRRLAPVRRRRMAPGHPLQRHPHLIELLLPGRIERDQADAPMRPRHQQPLALQLPQRLAHGNAADAEVGRQLALDQPLPRLQAPVGDGIHDPVRGLRR